MLGSIQSRRCNLRVVLDGAEGLRTELEAMRSRRDWAMDSSLSLDSGRLKDCLFHFSPFAPAASTIFTLLFRAGRVSW